MSSMKDLRLSIESLESDFNIFGMQSAALEALDANPAATQLDAMMTKLGLESATALYTTIMVSQESLGSWVREKVSALTHQVQIITNKIYAKITSADDKVKEAIRLAEEAGPDADIKLPVSKAASLATVGVIAAAAAAVALLTKAALARPEEAPKTTMDKIRDKAREVADTAKEKAGEVKEKATKVVNKVRGVEEPKTVVEKARALVTKAIEGTKQTGEDIADSAFVKKVGDELSRAYGSLRTTIKAFLSAVTRVARGEGADEASVMARVRHLGHLISGVLKIVWEALANTASKALSVAKSVGEKTKTSAEKAKELAQAAKDKVAGK